ncbi:unnamed protein product, partial [Nesidiocoris tenuis]
VIPVFRSNPRNRFDEQCVRTELPGPTAMSHRLLELNNMPMISTGANMAGFAILGLLLIRTQ